MQPPMPAKLANGQFPHSAVTIAPQSPLNPGPSGVGAPSDHAYQDRVSLALARRVADGLPTHPEWLELARENLRRWMVLHAESPALLRADREWLAILDRPVEEICAILTAPTDEGQRLRQNSPFVGVVPHREVWEIKRRMRHEADRT